MTVEVDRSRIIAYQRCPRERFLGYHIHGKGLQRKAKSLPLQVGSAFHEGAELLLANDIEGAVKRATGYLQKAFAEKGVGLDGEEQTDASLLYSAQEQMALSEALIRAWGLERLEEFLQTFEVVEVEKEGRAELAPDLTLMFRPDALVRDRLSGDLYVVSWKTAASYGKRTLQQCRTDMQSMSEVWGIEASSNDAPRIEGTLYLFIVKGKRQFDEPWGDQPGQWKQNTHLLYAWKNVKPKSDDDEMWSWSFKWTDETGGHSLGKGWKKVSVWDNYPGGTKAWIEDLHNRSIFPRHVDPFESVFPQSLPVERRADEVERWKRQVVAQELDVAAKVADIESLVLEDRSLEETLDIHFPQYTHSCSAYSGCSFIDICHHGVPAEPGELYQIRSANHPESEEEE